MGNETNTREIHSMLLRMRMFDPLVNIILTLPFGLHNRIRPIGPRNRPLSKTPGGGGLDPQPPSPPREPQGVPWGTPNIEVKRNVRSVTFFRPQAGAKGIGTRLRNAKDGGQVGFMNSEGGTIGAQRR